MDTKQNGKYEVTLVVDGKRIATNFFVKEILGGGVEGMIGGLKGVESPEKIELTVTRTGK